MKNLIWCRPTFAFILYLSDKFEIGLVALSLFLYYSFSFFPEKRESKFAFSLFWITLFLVVFFLRPGFGFLYLTFELSLIPILFIIIR